MFYTKEKIRPRIRKEVRPRNRKTRRFETHTSFLIKSILVAIGTVITIYATLYYKAQPVEYVKVENITVEKIDYKILKLMKRDLVKTLRWEELNRELVPGELLYTNDPTKSMQSKCNRIGGKRDINCDSWGPMQLKIPTVQYYYMQLYGKELTEVEALLIALDEEKAMAFAEDIIFEIEGSIWNWENSVNKKKSYYMKQIPFIRETEASL